MELGIFDVSARSTVTANWLRRGGNSACTTDWPDHLVGDAPVVGAGADAGPRPPRRRPSQEDLVEAAHVCVGSGKITAKY